MAPGVVPAAGLKLLLSRIERWILRIAKNIVGDGNIERLNVVRTKEDIRPGEIVADECNVVDIVQELDAVHVWAAATLWYVLKYVARADRDPADTADLNSIRASARTEGVVADRHAKVAAAETNKKSPLEGGPGIEGAERIAVDENAGIRGPAPIGAEGGLRGPEIIIKNLDITRTA